MQPLIVANEVHRVFRRNVTEIRGLSESAVTMSERPVTQSERAVDVWKRRLTKRLPGVQLL
jgi:hypothetical protein